MHLYVHSAGRGHLPLPTLDTLLASKRAEEVGLVVQGREVESYRRWVGAVKLIVLPPHIKQLSPTRQWILDNAPINDKFVLFDDDLTFSTRRKDDYTKFLPISRTDVNRMLNRFDDLLDRYAHVGLMAREGGNRVPVDAKGKPVSHLEATRMMRVLGYNRGLMPENARFDRLPTKQDFDMTLQLLRAGCPNAVITEFVHNQAGSNTEGGCSTYRNAKMMESSARKLAKLHKGFVEVVEKETKTSWGGGTRIDVQVAWKKALASAEQ